MGIFSFFKNLFGKKEVFTSLNFNNMYAADAHFYEQAEQQFMVQKLDLRTYIYYRNHSDSITVRLKDESLSLSK